MWEFIKYIFSFWIRSRKRAEEKRQEKFAKANNEFQDEFKKIDNDKENEKKDNLENRINNMFN